MKANLLLPIVLGLAAQVTAQETETKLDPMWIVPFNDINLVVDGHTQITYIEGASYDGSILQEGDFGFTHFQPLLNFSNTDKTFGFTTMFNLTDAGIEDSNWLTDAWFWWELNDTWEIRLGRISTSLIYVTPPPRFSETIAYPRLSRNISAYGVQAIGKLSPKLTLYTDIGGKGWGGTSGASFQESESIEELEWSARLVYGLSDSTDVAIGTQISEDYSRFTLDATTKPTADTFIRAAGYVFDENAVDDHVYGAWALGAYTPTDNWEIHGMVDYQDSDVRGDSTIFTAGFRRFFAERKWDVGVDYQHATDDIFAGDDNRFLFRLRYRFGDPDKW